MKMICTTLAACTAWALCAGPVRVWPRLENPRLHPDDARRAVKPPSWEDLGNRVHLLGLRSLLDKDYAAQLDRHVADRLGDFVWANAYVVLKPDVAERVAAVKARGLWLFDLWGYLPGSGGPCWTQFKVPEGVTEMMAKTLGAQWLGMDNGEQDGRWFSTHACYAEPNGMDRFGQYKAFRRWFGRLEDELGGRMCANTGLTYGGYFLRANNYMFLGAETAQSLPNVQVFYAFIRGACKQYGVPWFGNVSTYNRWGWKTYGPEGEPIPDPEKKGPGPTKGTSLALMKKLLYAETLYNCSAVGCEMALYRPGWKLSPIGTMQQALGDWCATNGLPGVFQTPVALLFDTNAGWTVPRHNYMYAGKPYVVWGGLPYEPGDYFAAGVLGMLYPGYEDSGFYRDEKGFLASTPYGDCADCLLSDAPGWLLDRYSAVVLVSGMDATEELCDTLRGYAARGGRLVMTRAHAARLFPAGVPAGAEVIGGAPWGVAEESQCARPIEIRTNAPLANPHPLTAEARAALDRVFRDAALFTTCEPGTDDGLATLACRRGPGEWTVGVFNNTWSPRPFALRSRVGAIRTQEELPTDRCERTAVGFAPEKTTPEPGADAPGVIAAGAVRIFRVKTAETPREVTVLPAARPPANPVGRLLRLEGDEPLEEQLLARPTFRRHWDGVLLDARRLMRLETNEVAAAGRCLARLGLDAAVDLSGVINTYPDYRWIDNDKHETARRAAFLDAFFPKAKRLGAKDLFVVPHWEMETGLDAKTCRTQVAAAIRAFARRADALGMRVYIRQSNKRLTPWLDQLNQWVAWVDDPNVRAAPSLASLLEEARRDPENVFTRIARCKTDLWLMAAPVTDANGWTASLHAPLDGRIAADHPVLKAVRARGGRLVFDALYPDRDAEYREARLLEGERSK